MTGMDELVTWLRAQLDEDERVALAVFRSRIRADGHKVMSIGPPGFPDLPVADAIDAPTAEHIARWSGQRVVAEVEAKRRILDEYEAWCESSATNDDPVHSQAEHDISSGVEIAIKVLALPYAGREGYRDEWRP